MKRAEIVETVDTEFKGGFVECRSCGWHQDFGDGFNQYYIASCPKCDKTINTWIRRKVMVGRPNNLTVYLGQFHYFTMSNGIHTHFEWHPYSEHRGLSERRADAL